MCKAVLLVLVVVALGSRPVFAEDAPVSLRIGSRVGLEGGTTIQGPGKGWNGGALTLGLDADKFIRPYLLGADVGVGTTIVAVGVIGGSTGVGVRLGLLLPLFQFAGFSRHCTTGHSARANQARLAGWSQSDQTLAGAVLGAAPM